MAGDETRNLIDGAQSMVSKSKTNKGNVDDLVAEADALAGKGSGPPSTRQLVVEAEKLIGRKQAPKGKRTLTIAAVVIVALGLAAAAWWLMLRS